MKNLLLVALTTAALATSATAGSITFSIPNLTFPSTQDVTVAKDYLAGLDATAACLPQG
jgi:hypothetical protein